MPILVLSGRTEDAVKIAALEHGADDYMTKPFAMHDLVLRVRSALQHQNIREKSRDNHIRTGVLDIHLGAHEVKRDAHPVALEDGEYELLRLLALHGGRVMTYGRIERALWGSENDVPHRQDLQKRITGLRRKLEDEPSFPRYIVSEPAIGYRLEILPDDERAA
jgi:two-component system KDP operon response regulator KdpE